MSDIKPFKTFTEQLDILKKRGLIINDESKAIEALKRVNYYRISGYTLTLRKDDIFYKDVTFDNVLEVYNFDTYLKAIIMHLLEHIEVAFRTHVAYYHADKYGPLGYLGYEGFENQQYHDKFIDEFRAIVADEKRNSEVFAKHHIDNYSGQFPIWVAVELLSFGDISKFYNNSVYEIRQKIALDNYGIKEEYIQGWIHGAVVLRNICAHRGRLYNRLLSIKPRISNKDKKLNLRNDLVFIYLFIFKKLIKDKSVWENAMAMLKNTIQRYPFVKLDNLGFPENWIELLKYE